MPADIEHPITEKDLYAGFTPVVRWLLWLWKNRVARIDPGPTTQEALASLDAHLAASDAVVFIDHHYAFDTLPLALGLGKVLKNVRSVLIPYAAHLDMGVDPNGLPSRLFRVRTWAFRELREGLHRGAPGVRFLPIVRDFELENPRLKEIAERMHPGATMRYLRALVDLFAAQRPGTALMMAPMAAMALPHRAVLHPQLYRSLELVQSRCGRPLSFFLVGAYPRWNVYASYLAPLFGVHTLVALDRFSLPMGDYEAARAVIAERLAALRRAASFTPPDYNRIKHK